jgi:hypothetical protein
MTVMPDEDYDVESRSNLELIDDLLFAKGWEIGADVNKQAQAWFTRLVLIQAEILKRMSQPKG